MFGIGFSFYCVFYSYRRDVTSFPRKIFTFCGISTVNFRVGSSSDVLRLSGGKARFLPVDRTISRFGNFLKINWNLYTLWFRLESYVKRKNIGL